MSGKVDFVVAGTQKGGTTALTEYLRRHPDVQMASIKEVHFFDREEYFTGESVDYAQYHSFFDFSVAGKRRGESTPIYMYWHDCARRMWEYHPGMRVIMILRNPVERAYSHWNMERSRGADDCDFSTAVRTEAERCREALPLQHRVYSYVDRGFYTEQLRRMWRYFPPDQTLVLKQEELLEQPGETLARVWEFLSVPDPGRLEPVTSAAGDYAPLTDTALRDYLQGIYEHEIRQLERMLGWDCSGWL